MSPREVEATFTTEDLYKAGSYLTWRAEQESKAIEAARGKG